MKSEKPSVLFGSAFYDEYIPTSDLEHDFTLMKKAGFTVIRVGEGSWSKWEPEDGKFNIQWLRAILDKAYHYGISVIIGMPTFSVPRWMARKYPEIALREQSGLRKKFGTREEHNYSHPTFKFYAQRICEKIAKEYSSHPSVIGWQVYNEPGLFENFSTDAFEGFKDYLRSKYKTVERLNKDWGLVFWSHELSCWDDLWEPTGNGSPQYDVEWKCYQQRLTDELIVWAADEIRKYIPETQFVTTCISFKRVTVDESTVCESTDIAAANIYYQMQDALAYDVVPTSVPETAFQRGAWSLTYSADYAYSMKQKPFYIFETNGGPVGGSGDNYPAWDGQWRQAAFQMISRGAQMIEYWHWQSLHYGTETFWGGILPHDRQPGRVYEAIAGLGNEISILNESLSELEPDADIAFLYSVHSRNALAYQPHYAEDVSNPHVQRNAQAYDDIVNSFYKGAYESGAQVRFFHDSQIFTVDGKYKQEPKDFYLKYKVLIVSGLYCADESVSNWLSEYAEIGGHVILGSKSLFANMLACPTDVQKPSYFTDASGCFYQEYTTLDEKISIELDNSISENETVYIDTWLECLVPTTGIVLARPNHPQLSRYAAIVTNNFGDGRVTTIGSIPDLKLASIIINWALGSFEDRKMNSGSVRVSSAINRNGEKIYFVFNWSADLKKLDLPFHATRIDRGMSEEVSKLSLEPWDVQILKRGE